MLGKPNNMFNLTLPFRAINTISETINIKRERIDT